jgi:hypothetical protein
LGRPNPAHQTNHGLGLTTPNPRSPPPPTCSSSLRPQCAPRREAADQRCLHLSLPRPLIPSGPAATRSPSSPEHPTTRERREDPRLHALGPMAGRDTARSAPGGGRRGRPRWLLSSMSVTAAGRAQRNCCRSPARSCGQRLP